VIGEKKVFIRLQGLQEVERGVLASIASLGRGGSGGASCSDYSYFGFIHLTYSSENIMTFVGGRALREGAEEHLQGRPGEVLTVCFFHILLQVYSLTFWGSFRFEFPVIWFLVFDAWILFRGVKFLPSVSR